MIIWTYVNRPFVMGGRVNQPTGCEVDPGEELDLGKGYKGYQITCPSGKTMVVEKTSGAIVGNDIAQVRQDVEEGGREVMAEQVDYAVKESKGVHVISKDEFWSIYDRR